MSLSPFRGEDPWCPFGLDNGQGPSQVSTLGIGGNCWFLRVAIRFQDGILYHICLRGIRDIHIHSTTPECCADFPRSALAEIKKFRIGGVTLPQITILKHWKDIIFDEHPIKCPSGQVD